MSASENRVLRRKFVFKEQAGKLRYGTENENAHRIFTGKCEKRRPLGRSRRSWEDNIKKDKRGLKRQSFPCA
jgi:hypothetical protein